MKIINHRLNKLNKLQWQQTENWMKIQHIIIKFPKIKDKTFFFNLPNSSGHVWVWELDCEESWVLKNWFFWTVALEKTLQSPLDCKEIQPVYPKGDQSWVFIGRTDAEAETPILWPPHAKSWLIGKDSDAGRDWGQEEKGMTEDEMAGWHHWLDGHKSGWTLGVGDGQGGLACCNLWDHKESDTTEWLNWKKKDTLNTEEKRTRLTTNILLEKSIVWFHLYVKYKNQSNYMNKTNMWMQRTE